MFVVDETQERSPYWLSPGIDVPTREEILPGMRNAKGLFHICDEHAEGAFVPTAAFMRNSPTWRLDVLGDILLDIPSTTDVNGNATLDVFVTLTSGNYDGNLQILDEYGVELAWVDPAGLGDPAAINIALTPGTYIIRIGANSGSGTYTVQVDLS